MSASQKIDGIIRELEDIKKGIGSLPASDDAGFARAKTTLYNRLRNTYAKIQDAANTLHREV